MIPFGEVRWTDVKGRPSWRWATVTSRSPALALVVDGDEAPIGVEPTVLAHVGPLTVGTRVWCQVTPGGAVVIIGRAGPPLLRPLVLTGGWSPDAAEWAPPTFMVDSAGFVRLDGRVAGGTDMIITTLPPGARPAARTALLGLGRVGTGLESPQRIDVLPSGEVQAIWFSTPGAWLSLSGLSFPAAR